MPASIETEEQRRERNLRLIQEHKELVETGGVTHYVDVVRHAGIPDSEDQVDVEPTVQVWNDGDSHYVEAFRNAEEVDRFIAELEKAKKEAFGTNA